MIETVSLKFHEPIIENYYARGQVGLGMREKWPGDRVKWRKAAWGQG